MAAGGSLREAAAFLGIDERYIAPGRETDVAAAAYRADGTDPVEFRLAVRALAQQLNNTTGLIDYKNRRDALHDWYLDEPTRQEIIDRLRAPRVLSARRSATANANSPPKSSGPASPEASTSWPLV